MSELTSEQTRDILRGLIEENSGIPASSIQDDSTIGGDLAMDSMSFVSLQVAVEDKFGISCTLDELETAGRFESIVALVHGRLSGQGASSAPRRGTKRSGARGSKS